MSSVKRMHLLLKKDVVFMRFHRQMTHLWVPEFDTQKEEIKSLHLGRSVRLLDKGIPTARRIAEAAAQDQAVRSRLVEIAINATIVRNQMSVGITTVQKHLEASFFHEMKSMGVSGVNDRKSLIASIVAPYQRRYDRVCTLIDIADMVIKDIEASGWTIKHMIDAITVAAKREGTM